MAQYERQSQTKSGNEIPAKFLISAMRSCHEFWGDAADDTVSTCGLKFFLSGPSFFFLSPPPPPPPLFLDRLW